MELLDIRKTIVDGSIQRVANGSLYRRVTYDVSINLMLPDNVKNELLFKLDSEILGLVINFVDRHRNET